MAPFHTEAIHGENESQARIALEKEAQASQRSQVAAQQAQTEIQRARALAQTQLLEAEQVVPQEILKKKIQIEAEAEAQRTVLIARGEASAILAIKQAEAEGIQKLLDAKARGYKLLVEACGHDPKSASTMLLIEKLEEIVKLQVEAIKGIKIDKITVWDSGHNSGDPAKGSTTSNFISQFVKALPALHDVAGMAGLDLPQYLGKVTSSPEAETVRKV